MAGDIPRTIGDGPFAWFNKSAFRRIRAGFDSSRNITSATAIYAVLAEFASDEQRDTFVRTKGQIAQRAGLKERRTFDLLSALEGLGLVRIRQNKIQGSSLDGPSEYTLLAVPVEGSAWQPDAPQAERGTQATSSAPGENSAMQPIASRHAVDPPAMDCLPPCTESDAQKRITSTADIRIIREESSEESPEESFEESSEESSEESTSDEEEIEAIYEAYPRKVGKQQALKAIGKALKSVTFEALLAKTKAYAASRQGQDPQYTPHPGTWFGQRRWEDEIEARAPVPSAISPLKRLEAVQKLIQEHPANHESENYRMNPKPELRAELDALRAKEKTLYREIAQ